MASSPLKINNSNFQRVNFNNFLKKCKSIPFTIRLITWTEFKFSSRLIPVLLLRRDFSICKEDWSIAVARSKIENRFISNNLQKPWASWFEQFLLFCNALHANCSWRSEIEEFQNLLNIFPANCPFLELIVLQYSIRYEFQFFFSIM